MKKIFKVSAVASVMMMSMGSSFSQDLHYADVRSMNLWYNQSLKMDRESDIRLNFRDIRYQSLLAFRTGTVLLNLPLQKKERNIQANEKGFLDLSIGGAFDRSNKGIFKNSTGMVGLSYKQALSQDQLFLSAGFQGTMTRSVLGSQSIRFQDQFDQYGPLPTATRDLLRMGRSYNWMSLNAGLSVFQNTETREWYLGASLRHINRPFTDEQKTTAYRLAPTVGLQAGMTMKGDNESFGVYWISNLKAEAYEHLIGVKMIRQLSGEVENGGTSVGVGLALRLRDAIIPNIQMNFEKVTIGIHYDVNISGLRATGFQRQGFEVAISRKL